MCRGLVAGKRRGEKELQETQSLEQRTRKRLEVRRQPLYGHVSNIAVHL